VYIIKGVIKMDRKEELEFMLKVAEVNVLYACKAVCESGLTADTKASLDYAIERYNSIHCSLTENEYPVNVEEVENNAE
jgi:hypothetical protein